MNRSALRLLFTLALGCLAAVVLGAGSAAAGTIQISAGGTTSPQTGAFTAALDGFPEFAGEADDEDSPDPYNGIIDRSLSRGSGSGAASAATKHAKSSPQLQGSFEGLN